MGVAQMGQNVNAGYGQEVEVHQVLGLAPTQDSTKFVGNYVLERIKAHPVGQGFLVEADNLRNTLVDDVNESLLL
jgi:hypothetical protein